MKFSSAAASSTSSTSTVGSQSLKLKKNTHAAFQFLRSKPPINPQADPQTNSSKQQQQQQIVVTDIFADAKQVLATDEIDQNLKTNTNSLKQADASKFTSRLSYPFISVSNENAETQINNADNFSTEATSGQSSTKTSAKRLLFNFISGNSNNNNNNDAISRNPNQHLLKLQHVQLQGSQQRRLSDYHRPLKVSENFYLFKCHIL
jgi:hypothetical protein